MEAVGTERGFPPVEVVDGVGPVVLDVPGEGSEAHADVAPRHLHAADVHADVLQHRGAQHRQVVEIPPAPDVLVVSREPS